ncbi:anti-sigma factor family protein [Kitasatospora sp. NPDC057692]|uniref:anti-sigma factor family protein n=1 Tax=Kitasatospora sp. NPDC057692 TaxID=3346215 RepID=UPI003676710C
MTAPLSSPDPAAGAHPEVDELADLAEDLLPPAQADALRRHLTDCAECRETVDALAGVRTLLGEAGLPPMPADVAARIDAALADEALAAAEAEAAEPPVPAPPTVRPTTLPTTRTEDPRAGRPVAPPAAPPARPAAATGPGRSARPRRRRTLLLGSAAALLVLGLGGAFLALPDAAPKQDSSTAANAPAPGGTAAARADRTPGGTVYREEQLAAQVRDLLAGTDAGRPVLPAKPSPGAGAGSGAGPSDGSDPTAAPPAEEGQGLTGGGRSAPACPPPSTAALLATGRGSYAGSPAELLVYALPGRPDQLDVYLRAPGCELLLHRTLPAD